MLASAAVLWKFPVRSYIWKPPGVAAASTESRNVTVLDNPTAAGSTAINGLTANDWNPYTVGMDVQFTPDQETQLKEMAAKTGREPMS
jgi:hypothetical protein